ncbi:Cell wall-associated polypeptide CWBP200 [Bordetella ansorpii]|uniref:Cell wall-associated polypeptide CWBP200 n=1 Tax=Bordetella ansorpii TaxID=288768 RepID=A0A157NWW5_9BORD|nr:RHS repeat-associated core domain-containing protein [Bordetella ansorpii]SAI25738.1 Cell wall-associated polypeptide CWBP200 [Bordetella ansorpii]
MSTEFIAEKRANHIAVADKPDMCKVGNTVCAFISFSTFDQARDLRGNPNPTNGQDTPVFHMGSYVPKSQGNAGIGIRSGGQSGPFNPQEHSSTVKSQGEFQVHDGHVGQINAATPGSLAGNTTAVVNAGATGGGEVDVCLTKLKLQLANLKEKIAAEWQNSPTDFMWATASGMGSGAVDAGSGMAEGVWGALQGAWGVVSNPWESAKGAYNSVTGGAKEALDLGQAIYNGELTIDDIVDGITEALMDALGATACSVADQLQEMLNKPNGGAEGLGYLLGQVAANVAVTAATAGAGAAGQAALKGTQAARLAGEASAFAMRKGESMAAFFKRLKHRRHERRNRPEPEGGAHVKDGSSNDGSPQNPGCRILCVGAVGHPVNPMYGCKFLAGAEDLDFVLPGLPSIQWQRSYFSDISRVGGFGQGWTLPFDISIVTEGRSHTFVDEQGRRVPLPSLVPGTLARVPGEEMLFGGLPDQSILLLADSSGRLMRFSAVGAQRWRLSSISDGYSNMLLVHWNDAGLLVAITSDSQRRVELDYVQTGHGARISAVHEVTGRSSRDLLMSYRYSHQGDLSQVYDAAGNLVREFGWRNHIMVMHRQPGGIESRYEYDLYTATGKVVRNSDSLDREWRLIYRDGETRVVDHLRRSSRYRYDEAKRLELYVDPEGGETRFELDGDGNVLQELDPAGRVRRYARNAQGLPLLITEPDGTQTFIEYHRHFPWLPTSITDALGQTRSYEYDGRGGLLLETDPSGQRTEYHRDSRGLVVAIRDARGGLKRLSYGIDGLCTGYADCSGAKTHYRYDVRGNLSEITDASGAATGYQYDHVGRLVSVRHPDGAAEHLAYDRLGRLIAYSDANGAITRYYLATDGKPVARIDPLGNALHYRYDAARRVSLLINENGARYLFGYDLLNRLTFEQGFDGLSKEYRYDASGWLFEKEERGQEQPGGHADVIRTRYQRDLAGRIVEFSASHARTREHVRSYYSYDALGRLVSAKNNAGLLAFAYDPLGRLISEVSAVAGVSLTVRHGYDELGNRVRTTLPDGRELNWLYYGSGHLHQVNVDGYVISDMERDSVHREVFRTQGRLQSTFGYDVRSRLIEQCAEPAPMKVGQTEHRVQPIASTKLSHTAVFEGAGLQENSVQRAYRYDAVGNVLAIADVTAGSVSYVYDALGRLRRSNEHRFDFDPASNIVEISAGDLANQAPSRSVTWPIGRDNHPFDVPAEPVSNQTALNDNRVRFYKGHRYVYDGFGNVVERRIGEHTVMRFEYDPLHRMVTAEVSRRGVTRRHRYSYDAANRRVGKRDEFGMTRFVWDGDRLMAVTRARRTSVFVYAESPYVPLARIDSTIKDGQPADEVFHYHVDQIGTPREVTTASGEVIWRAKYLAWGEVEVKEGGDAREVGENAASWPQPLRFQGQYYDDETGLHYNRHRYYDPHIGRFISQDVVGLNGGINAYQYAPNPLVWADPLGLTRCRCDCAQVLANMRASGREYGSKSSTPADGHHIIQHASVPQGTAGYSYGGAPSVQLQGPSTQIGSEHYLATQVQRQAGGGSYAAERRIGYKALRYAGLSPEEARCLFEAHVDPYFGNLGFTGNSPMRTVGNRR